MSGVHARGPLGAGGTRVALPRGVRTTPRIALGLITTLAAVAAAAPASATVACHRSCRCQHYDPQASYAPTGAYGVPSNARFFVRNTYPDVEPVIVLHVEGDPSAAIPFLLERIGRTPAYWVVPQMELALEGRYTLDVSWEHVNDGITVDVYVADPPDETPPELSAVLSSGFDEPPCETFVGTAIEIGATDDRFSGAMLLQTAVRVAGEREIVRFTYVGGDLVLGAGDQTVCAEDLGEWLDETYPGAEIGAEAEIEITLYDAAGNASPPVVLNTTFEETAAALNTERWGACGPCGCSAAGVDTGSGSAFGLPLLALMGLLWRRRRSR